jgi:hypothetical protein
MERNRVNGRCTLHGFSNPSFSIVIFYGDDVTFALRQPNRHAPAHPSELHVLSPVLSGNYLLTMRTGILVSL